MMCVFQLRADLGVEGRWIYGHRKIVETFIQESFPPPHVTSSSGPGMGGEGQRNEVVIGRPLEFPSGRKSQDAQQVSGYFIRP